MEAVLETMDVREIRERNHLQGMQEVANGVEMLETMDVREIWGRDRLQEMQEGVNGLEMLGTMDVREMVYEEGMVYEQEMANEQERQDVLVPFCDDRETTCRL